MRRRRSPDEIQIPPDLVVFDVSPYRTFAAYDSAFKEFLAAREAWCLEHGGELLAPYEVNGPAPIDRSRFIRSTG